MASFSFLQKSKTISNITITDKTPKRDNNIIVSVSDENWKEDDGDDGDEGDCGDDDDDTDDKEGDDGDDDGDE